MMLEASARFAAFLRPRPSSIPTYALSFMRALFRTYRGLLSAILLASLVLLRARETGLAQDRFEFKPDEPLETDRDSFTPATTTAGRGWTIIESSYSYIDNGPRPHTHSYPELLVRYGMTKRLELRAGWNFEQGGPSNPVSGFEFGDEDFAIEKEGRMLYGLKYETSEQSGWIPQSSLLVEAFTPTSGPSDTSTINFGEIIGWTLPNGWQWDTAIRYGTASLQSKHFDQWAPSTVLRMPVGTRWTAHVEYFGIYSSGREHEFTTHFVSFGPHFLLTRNIEIGVRVGFGLNEQSARFFSNAGVGWRF